MALQPTATSRQPCQEQFSGGTGCPIRRSQDRSLVTGSLGLIAGSHVLHRISTPRHSPYALGNFIAPTRSRSIQHANLMSSQRLDSYRTAPCALSLFCASTEPSVFTTDTRSRRVLSPPQPLTATALGTRPPWPDMDSGPLSASQLVKEPGDDAGTARHRHRYHHPRAIAAHSVSTTQ